MGQDPLVFDVLIMCDEGDEREPIVEAFRRDPHFRVYVVPAHPAPVVFDTFDHVDLVVATAGASADEVSRLVEAGPQTGVIVCRDDDEPVLVQADAVVSAADPSMAVIAARWLLGLPSRVMPARRSALRRAMRRS